jgi:hypothetical protein
MTSTNVSRPDAPSVLAALPHDRQTGRDRALEHGLAEATNDVPTIMDTVSMWDQHFALLVENEDGGLDLRLEVDRAGVQQFYEERVRDWLLEASYNLKKVQMPWYSLTESIGQLFLNPTQQKSNSHVAVIFPVWTDGIIGEIMWEPQFADPKADWRIEADISRRLIAFEQAWANGDVDTMMENVEDETRSVIRVVEVGGDRRQRTVAQSRAELISAWSEETAGRIIDSAWTNRVVTQSYAFSSYRLNVELADRRVEREMARLLPVGPNGRFIGELSYAFELEVESR